ncbi:MAG: MBL fold metallo-hydrolase [Ruminococcaceae bacterium]|nr:MBL fold metallo-hydrolase [Oscillospiraceae bacterium]
MKITCLAENTSVNNNIGAEHGLSLFIETKNHRILFDMGQTELFSLNAEKLGIDLSSVDIAILSHGHYDHGGGISEFLRLNKKAPLYINENAFGDHYNGTEKYIGLDKSLKNSSRIVFTGDKHKINDCLTLYTCNDKEKSFELGSFGLNMKKGDEFLPDDFSHEHYLLIEENGRKILISGCSHKGVLNIASWFKPDVLIGGFHFSKLSLDDTLKGYAEYLDSFSTDFYTCHCTGTEQYSFMKNYMNRLSYLSAGQEIEI